MRILTTCLTFLWLCAPALADPSIWQRAFPLTDFSRSTIGDWSEILSGGPGRDGIPALSDPGFRPARDETRLGPREPVITLELPGQTPRAYPLRYLMWHEIVNDRLGDIPVAVTFCPLCNSGMVFDRRVEGATLTFGVSGLLRGSDMVMYDRETESWWQQATGTGIVGQHSGTGLTQLPSWMESWAEFTARNPGALVMEEPQAPRDYGRNPYAGYDSRQRPYPFFTGEAPPHDIPALARVVRVGIRAWPLTRLSKAGTITESGLTLTWTPGQASALDSARISDGRDVGTIRVKDANGRNVPHDTLFAFAFHAFWPNGIWMISPD